MENSIGLKKVKMEPLSPLQFEVPLGFLVINDARLISAFILFNKIFHMKYTKQETFAILHRFYNLYISCNCDSKHTF